MYACIFPAAKYDHSVYNCPEIYAQSGNAVTFYNNLIQ